GVTSIGLNVVSASTTPPTEARLIGGYPVFFKMMLFASEDGRGCRVETGSYGGSCPFLEGIGCQCRSGNRFPCRQGRGCCSLNASGCQQSGRTQKLSGGHEDRIFVGPASHFLAAEDAMPRDPFKGILECLLGIRFEHETLTRSPSARIHLVVKTEREFFLVIMGEKFRAQIDIALRPTQGAEEFADVLRVRRASDHRCHHEGGVDNLAKAQLLDEIVRPAEQRRSRQLPVDQQFHSAEQ